MPTAPGVPRRHRRRVRAASSPDPPGSSWRLIKGPSHTGSSRTPFRPARRTRTIWQYWHVPALSGLLPPSPAPPGSGCPQLHRPAATGPAAEVSHLHSNHSASRRTHDVRHTYATLARDLGVNSKVVTDQLGHANETVTQQIYTHPSTGNDRPAAEIMIARLIAGALGTDEADLRARWSQSWSHGQRKRPSRSPLESRLAW